MSSVINFPSNTNTQPLAEVVAKFGDYSVIKRLRGPGTPYAVTFMSACDCRITIDVISHPAALAIARDLEAVAESVNVDVGLDQVRA